MPPPLSGPVSQFSSPPRILRFPLPLSPSPSALEGLPTTILGETRFLACFSKGRAVDHILVITLLCLFAGHSANVTHCTCASQVLTLCVTRLHLTRDLSDLREGRIITIVREDDSGWWQGEYNGKVGWFPYNYVELL